MLIKQFKKSVQSCFKILPSIYSHAGANVFSNSFWKSRQFHLWPACLKYHDLKKKKTLVKRRMDMLEARLSRLDKEDRPTGCILCPMRNDIKIDHKNTRLLSQFISPHTGRIYGKAITGLCDKKQREISQAIKRSRVLGFLPVTMKYFEYHNDPKLF